MSPSFIAYIDESGCHGGKFHHGSSEFLIMSAAIIPSWWLDVSDLFDRARKLRRRARTFKKFSKMGDHDRFALTNIFQDFPVTTCHVALHKPSLAGSEIRGNPAKEYAYLLKLTLERISWHVRDRQEPGDPNDGTCKLVFSQSDSVSYTELALYMDRLRAGRGIYNCSVEWQFISDEPIETEKHKNETANHLADIAASALGAALETRNGIPDDRFIRNLKNTIYRKNGKPYGLKVFPQAAIDALSESTVLDFIKLL